MLWKDVIKVCLINQNKESTKKNWIGYGAASYTSMLKYVGGKKKKTLYRFPGCPKYKTNFPFVMLALIFSVPETFIWKLWLTVYLNWCVNQSKSEILAESPVQPKGINFQDKSRYVSQRRDWTLMCFLSYHDRSPVDLWKDTQKLPWNLSLSLKLWQGERKSIPYSVRSSGSRWVEWPTSKARSVNSRERYSPKFTGQERKAPLWTRHSLTLSRPHDTILCWEKSG